MLMDLFSIDCAINFDIVKKHYFEKIKSTKKIQINYRSFWRSMNVLLKLNFLATCFTIILSVFNNFVYDF